jgi:hypoxanthine phosphoribosyltransferase
LKISSTEITLKVEELAKEISAYYKSNFKNEKLSIIVPMNGGVPFAVDLLRKITHPGADKIFISYIFDEKNEWRFSGSKPNTNSPILIIEDIYDTGDTLSKLVGYLNDQYSPSDIQVVVMLDKLIKKHSVVDVKWKGFNVEDTWVFGYGMDDENGTMRQIPFIADKKG